MVDHREKRCKYECLDRLLVLYITADEGLVSSAVVTHHSLVPDSRSLQEGGILGGWSLSWFEIEMSRVHGSYARAVGLLRIWIVFTPASPIYISRAWVQWLPWVWIQKTNSFQVQGFNFRRIGKCNITPTNPTLQFQALLARSANDGARGAHFLS